jgi:NAD(P)-dependent dehydrogenase (short-subunit alcohol dehydrogenase family)
VTGAATGIEGRVAIVTGTSSGLGRRFAQVLDEAGARLVLASRRHREDLDLAAQLRDAWPMGCDVRVAADREALVSAAVEHFGQVDILVNNAGVAYSGLAEEESAEHWQDLIDTNLTGLFALTQLVGRHMLGRGGGVIVNVASPAAAISLDRYGLAGYGATKAAVVALTRELAAQLGRTGDPGERPGTVVVPDRYRWLPAGSRSGGLDLRAHTAGPPTAARRAGRAAAVPGR